MVAHYRSTTSPPLYCRRPSRAALVTGGGSGGEIKSVRWAESTGFWPDSM